MYTHDPSSLVYRHYEAMRKHQCVDFVQRMEAKHFGFNHARMSIREAFDILKGTSCQRPAVRARETQQRYLQVPAVIRVQIASLTSPWSSCRLC